MQFDRAKLNTVILYACNKCEPSQLGAVKLNKVLYFYDMLYYAEYGHAVTGCSYRKSPFGPTCDQLASALRDLRSAGCLQVREVEHFGYRKKEFIPLKGPDLSRLGENEKKRLDEIIEFVCLGHSAKSISEFSHNRAWEIADFGEILPYHSVLQIFPTEVSLEAMEWAAKEAETIEAERSKSDPMGYVTFADFRSRVLEKSGL